MLNTCGRIATYFLGFALVFLFLWGATMSTGTVSTGHSAASR